MSKFRDDDNRGDRNEPVGDRPQRRSERVNQEDEAPGRSFRREAKIGLSVLGVLVTSLGGVAGLRMTGKMPQMFAKKPAAATTDADGGKNSDRPKLSSGPKYKSGNTPDTKSAAGTQANELAQAAGLMDNAAAGNVPADPFAANAAGDSGFANSTNVQVVDGEDPAGAAGNAWQQNAADQGQALLDRAQGGVDQAVDAAVDSAAGMVDQARQSLDASAKQYLNENLPQGAGQYADQAQQAYDQVADAVQQTADQAIDKARDLAQQGSRWAQDQVAAQQPAARDSAAAAQDENPWRGDDAAATQASDARSAQPIGDGQQWPEQPASGARDDLAVDAPTEPPLRIPTDPPARHDGYDRRRPAALDDHSATAHDEYPSRHDDRRGHTDSGYDSPNDQRRLAHDERQPAGTPLADQQDPWANEQHTATHDRRDDARSGSDARSGNGAWRDHEGYDSAQELFPEGRARRADETASNPPASGSTAGEPAGEQYTVQPDDNFWRISQKLYGTGAYFKALYEHNRARFPRADHMRAGDVIESPAAQVLAERYPDLVASSVRSRRPRGETQQVARSERQDGRRVYIVQQGDTLFDIARAELGRAVRWAEIYELNREVLGEDIENLQPGTELVLPADAGRLSSRSYRSRR